MKQRKIVLVNRFFFPDHSATSQILSDLCFELAARGAEVHVVSGRQLYDDPSAELQAQENVNGVRVHRVWTSRFGRARILGRAIDYLTFYPSAAWRLLCLLRRGDQVVAKTDPPIISVIAAWAASLRGAELVNWMQDMFPEVAGALGVSSMDGRLGRFLAYLRDRSLRAARVNVAIGEKMADRIGDRGIAADHIEIIHNWSDGRAIMPLAAADVGLREEWGLRDRFVVGYSGNIGRAHDFETIVDAIELLKGKPEIVFLIIGGGARKEWVEQQIRERGLQNVLFKPYQPRDRLSESLCVPDVHLISLFPGLEGLIVPSKFYGIAAAGRATVFIGDPQGEVPRILSKAGCGYSVQTGEARRLADTLLQLSENRRQCDLLGSKARNVFEQEYDKPLALAAWCRVLGVNRS